MQNWKQKFIDLRKKASDAYKLVNQLEKKSDTYFLLETQLLEFTKIDLRRNLASNKGIIQKIIFNF